MVSLKSRNSIFFNLPVVCGCDFPLYVKSHVYRGFVWKSRGSCGLSCGTDTRSYVPPVQIGEVMRGAAIGVIKASKSDAFPVGSYASGTVGWTELAVVKTKDLQKVDVPSNGKTTDALGVLGKHVSASCMIILLPEC